MLSCSPRSQWPNANGPDPTGSALHAFSLIGPSAKRCAGISGRHASEARNGANGPGSLTRSSDGSTAR